MYHVPINGVLEWATIEDSGLLLANVCGDDVPESFWRRFYNIGSGAEYRITNYEFEVYLLRAIGWILPKRFLSQIGLHCVISTAIGLQIPIRLMITCTSVTMCPSRNILRSFLSMCRATISWRR
mgnify:FL=1